MSEAYEFQRAKHVPWDGAKQQTEKNMKMQTGG
jgi:hypothetical protein